MHQRSFYRRASRFLPAAFMVILCPALEALAQFAAPATAVDHNAGAVLLRTNDLAFPADGSIRVTLSAEMRQNWQAPLSGLRGEHSQIGIVRADAGIARNVAVQVRGAIYQRMQISSAPAIAPARVPRQGTTDDPGDFTVSTLLRFFEQRGAWPAFGARFEVKLPITVQSHGLGLNTNDIFLAAMAMRRGDFGAVWADLGVGILASPVRADEQNDVMVYGLATSIHLSQRLDLIAEINGFASTRPSTPPGTESRGALRAGVHFQSHRFHAELLLSHGMTANEGKWGVLGGFGWHIALGEQK